MSCHYAYQCMYIITWSESIPRFVEAHSGGFRIRFGACHELLICIAWAFQASTPDFMLLPLYTTSNASTHVTLEVRCRSSAPANRLSPASHPGSLALALSTSSKELTKPPNPFPPIRNCYCNLKDTPVERNCFGETSPAQYFLGHQFGSTRPITAFSAVPIGYQPTEGPYSDFPFF